MLDQLHFLLGVQRHIYFESLYAVIIANNYSYTQLKCSNILFAYREDGQPIRNRQLILENSYPITYDSTLHAVDGIWWLVNYSNTFACISRPGNVILVLSTIFMVLIIAGNLEIDNWSVTGICLKQQQSQMSFFLQKLTVFLHTCATVSELPPNTSTMTILEDWKKTFIIPKNCPSVCF